jgi:chromosome segregation ATPase
MPKTRQEVEKEYLTVSQQLGDLEFGIMRTKNQLTQLNDQKNTYLQRLDKLSKEHAGLTSKEPNGQPSPDTKDDPNDNSQASEAPAGAGEEGLSQAS